MWVMEDMQAAEQIDAEDETDLLDLFLDGRYEKLLATVDAECDRTDRKDLPSSAAIAAIAAAQLGRPDDAIEWLTRSPTSDLTRADHLLLADWIANPSLGRLLHRRGPVVALIAGGGKQTRAEVQGHLAARIPIITLTGTGRTTDDLAEAPDHYDGLIVVDVRDSEAVTVAVRKELQHRSRDEHPKPASPDSSG